MDMVETEIGDETDVNVFVTIDDEGNIDIKKSDNPFGEMSDRRHKRIKMHMMGDGPMDRHAPGRHMMAMMGHPAASMSEGAANCIIKNLNKINSDAGAHLLRRLARHFILQKRINYSRVMGFVGSAVHSSSEPM